MTGTDLPSEYSLYWSSVVSRATSVIRVFFSEEVLGELGSTSLAERGSANFARNGALADTKPSFIPLVGGRRYSVAASALIEQFFGMIGNQRL